MFTSPVPTSPGFPDPRFPDPWLIRAEEATPDMDFVFEEGSRAQGAVLKALSSPASMLTLSPSPCNSSSPEASLLPWDVEQQHRVRALLLLRSPVFNLHYM